MFKQTFNGCSIGKVSFETKQKFDTERAKEYAMQRIKESGSYINCTIGKVYVNGELVLENVKIS